MRDPLRMPAASSSAFYRLCRYAGYVLVVLGDDTGGLPSSLLKFSECLTGASHRNSKCAPRGVHYNPPILVGFGDGFYIAKHSLLEGSQGALAEA